MSYSTKVNPDGNVELSVDGNRVYTGTQASVTQMMNEQRFLPTPVAPATPATTNPITPTHNPQGVSSSSMAVNNTNQAQAMSNAGNAITGQQTPQQPINNPVGYTPQYDGSATGLTAEQAKEQDQYNKSKALIDQSYDAQVASKNALYQQKFDQLKQDTQIAHQAWNALSGALNPYGHKTTSSNLVGYHDRLDQKAATLAASLTQQAQAADSELQAGRIQAYLNIQTQMNQQMKDFKQGAAQEQQWMAAYMKQDQQYNETLKVQQGNQALTAANQAADNFRQLLTATVMPDEKAIDGMALSGELYNNPLFQEGQKAGYTPQAIIAIMKSGSLAAEKAASLEANRQAQVEIDNKRVDISQQNADTAVRNSEIAARNSQTAANRAEQSANTTGTLTYESFDANTGMYNYRNNKTGELKSFPAAGGAPGANTLSNSAAYTNTIGLLRGSDQIPEKTKMQITTNIMSAVNSGNEAQAKQAVIGAVKDALPSTSLDMFNGYETVASNLAMIKQDIANLPADQKTGFVSGNWTNALTKLGTTNSALKSKIETEIKAATQAYVNQISGKQFTDKERKAYGEVMPSITKDQTLNTSTMEGFLSTVASTRAGLIKGTIGEQNYNAIFAPAAAKTTSGNGWSVTKVN